MRKLLVAFAIFYALLPVFVFAEPIPVPIGGETVTLSKIEQLVENIVEFAITMSTVIIVGAFIYAGFMWATAGDNSGKVEKAKKILWNTIVGALIVFGVGVIMNTIADFGKQPTQIMR